MIKVLINACTNGNLGDDLFVRTILERYREWDVRFVLLVWDIDKYQYMVEEYSKLKLHKFPKPNLPVRIVAKFQEVLTGSHVIKELGYRKAYEELGHEQFDVLINVGGSSFAEYENELWHLYLLKEELLISQVNALHKVMLNINFGPFVTESYRKRCEILFARYEYIIFRDQKTIDTFPNLINSEIAPDIVFNMDLSETIREVEVDDDLICVNVIDLKANKRTTKERGPYIDDYERKIKEIISILLDNGVRICLTGFEGVREENYIDSIIAAVQCSNTPERITKLLYNGSNFKEMIQSMARARAILSTRFHAMILSIIMNKVQYPICYDDKMTNFLTYIQYKEPYSVLADIAEATEIADYLRTALHYENKYTDVIMQSENHFKYLDIFLRGGY